MKRKTVTINKKRYAKSKPADLYTATLYRTEYTRDEDGEQVDGETEVQIKTQLYSLKEILDLIEQHTGTSDCDENYDSMYFDSDYEDGFDGTETRWTLQVHATEHRIDRLHKIAAPDQYRRRNRWRIEREEQARKDARKANLTVIDGGNQWLSRRSRAELKRVV